MPQVNLTDEEWRTVMAVLAKGPWDVVNPLLMQMGEQLRQRSLTREPQPKTGDGNTEAQHGQQRRADARKQPGGSA